MEILHVRIVAGFAWRSVVAMCVNRPSNRTNPASSYRPRCVRTRGFGTSRLTWVDMWLEKFCVFLFFIFARGSVCVVC